MKPFTQENLVQLEAIDKINRQHKLTVELHLIAVLGAEFRATIEEIKENIEEIKEKEKRIPTADELIWLAGVHMGKDPKEIGEKR
jgi:hypothetical protein